jgi:putative oxidoreductase
MRFARLLLRLAVGGFFVGHGTQKLFGWFGGGGLEATAEGFEQLGLRPGRENAIAAGVAEAGGGALLVAGLETPLAAAVLTATMLTAIRTVHLKNGPWAAKGGYEYNVVLIGSVLALAEVGAGPLSLDEALGHERSGPGWAWAALACGALGAAGAYLSANSQAAAAATTPSHAAAPPMTPPQAPATATAGSQTAAAPAAAESPAAADGSLSAH